MPAIEPLVRALAPRNWRRRWLAVALAGAALSAAAGVAWARTRSEAAPCTSSAMAEAWRASDRDALERAFRASQRPFAELAIRHVEGVSAAATMVAARPAAAATGTTTSSRASRRID